MYYIFENQTIMKHFYLVKLVAFVFAINFIGCQQAPKEVQAITVSGTIDENTHWTADKNYILDNQVTVAPGATLTIDPGTVIKANAGEAPMVSMLVIARGGKIMAKGTADQPIIFTTINDNLDRNKGVKSLLNNSDVGLWGGVIILGNAPVTLPNADKETFYIGLEPTSNNSFYGGEDAEDDSGVMEYVSIRHGGVFIGTGSESNGLTLCGVGSKTKLSNIEIFANQDDGIELFGGTVNVSNLIVHASNDDAIDIDEGYAGTISNFLVELVEDSDSALEISGSKSDSNAAFALTNGSIDGMQLENVTLYTIEENAKGAITDISLINMNAEANKTNNAKDVVVQFATEAKNEMDFSWTRTKRN